MAKPIRLDVWNTNINYLNEEAFKTILDNPNGSINLYKVDGRSNSTIDCSDCRNYWLIKQNREKQVFNANCNLLNHTLFDQEIKTKLSQKCK